MKAKEAIKIIGDWISEETHKRKYNKVEIAKLSEALIHLKCITEQQDNRWIPIRERLPENEQRVLICADRKSCKGEIIKIITTAMYEDGIMHTEDSGYVWNDCDFEYCEETDDYIIPEGWYEQNMYCEEFGIVDDFVTHWMPLPEPYKEVSE